MQKINVGHIYDVVSIFSAIGKQEMDIESAAQVADAIEGVTVLLGELEEKRQELLARTFEKDDERQQAFEEFAKEEREIGAINFANFPFLRLTPNDILALKSAGLYVKNKDA